MKLTGALEIQHFWFNQSSKGSNCKKQKQNPNNLNPYGKYRMLEHLLCLFRKVKSYKVKSYNDQIAVY